MWTPCASSVFLSSYRNTNFNQSAHVFSLSSIVTFNNKNDCICNKILDHDWFAVQCIIKQLLDEVFVISRIIKVSVRAELRLRTLTETLIIPIITKTKCNKLFYYTLNEKKWKSCFCFFTDGKATQSVRTWHYYPWTWVSLTCLLYNLQLWLHRHWFQKFSVRFRPIIKELESSMYNNLC